MQRLALATRVGLVGHMFKTMSPDPLILELSARPASRDAAIHMFGFGGTAASARWLSRVQAGRFTLDDAGGFRVHLD